MEGLNANGMADELLIKQKGGWVMDGVGDTSLKTVMTTIKSNSSAKKDNRKRFVNSSKYKICSMEYSIWTNGGRLKGP